LIIHILPFPFLFACDVGIIDVYIFLMKNNLSYLKSYNKVLLHMKMSYF